MKPAHDGDVDPLSLRAVLAGFVVGFVVSAMNVSFGLKAGWAQGGSILAAAVSIGLFSALKPKVPFTQAEANICQTVASAAGSMTMAAGLIGPIPALQMLGHKYDGLTIMAWGASVAYLGVFFAVPMRRHFLVDHPLKFPSGTATAATITSMFADASRARDQVRTLLISSAVAALCVVATWLDPWLLKPPILKTLGFSALARWGWGVRLDATLVGGGVLMGPKVGVSILFGAIVAWGFVGPHAEAMGWVSGDPLSMKGGARGLLLWPGVAAMVVDSLAQLAIATARSNKGSGGGGGGRGLPGKGSLGGVGGDGDARVEWDYEYGDGRVAHTGGGNLDMDDGGGRRAAAASGAISTSKLAGPTLVGWGGLESGRSSIDDADIGMDDARPLVISSTSSSSTTTTAPGVVVARDHHDVIPAWWWKAGVAAGGACTAIILNRNFDMAPWQPALALPVAGVMSYIAVRCTGETDINPIGPMGKVIQLVFALAAPGEVVTNLMAAAVACGGAGQAGDLMHDFKAGLMMRLSPRKQLIAQLLGIPVGILGAVPAYVLFRDVYPLGGEQFPAPAAVAWKAVAEVLTNRSSAGGGGGIGGLPSEAKALMQLAACCTIFVRLVEVFGRDGHRRGWAWVRHLPSPTSAGIAFIIPPEFSVVIAASASASGWWRRRRPTQHEDHANVMASGLLAGAGVMGVVTAMASMALGVGDVTQ